MNAVKRLIMASICAALPCFAQTPLPDDLKIVPPAPDVANEIAVFSGSWAGKWVDRFGTSLDHQLVVEKVEGRTATVIYSTGVAPSWGINKEYQSRIPGEFRDDGTLRLRMSNGAVVTYRMLSDGNTMEGEYARGTITRGTFKRGAVK